jgi:AraC-like DNA-binding protein
MSFYQGYEAGFHSYFHLRPPAPAVAWTLRKSNFLAPDVRSDTPDRRLATPPRGGNAFILGLRRDDFTADKVLLGGRSIPVVPFPKGLMSLVNLALDPTPYPDNTSECFSFYLRRDTFDRLADNLGGNRIDDLSIKPGVAANDPVIANLRSCLLPAMERPEQLSRIFVDHVVMALHTHLAQRYGGMRMPRTSGGGSLTPWQLRLAQDMMDAQLDRGISLAQIARDCGLSVNYFARAFTCSTGIPPHRWLMQRRVNRAMDMMRGTNISLAEIALACGFCDQSHFTRLFSRATGTTPSEWRRIKSK